MIRRIILDHATCQRWIIKLVSLIEEKMRKSKKPVSRSWGIGESYIKVQGEWMYLYIAVGKYGNTIDFLPKNHKDRQSGKAFLKKSIDGIGKPGNVVIDTIFSNIFARKSINENKKKSDKIKINRSKYLNNMAGQDHIFIKERTRPMLGFKSIKSAEITPNGI